MLKAFTRKDEDFQWLKLSFHRRVHDFLSATFSHWMCWNLMPIELKRYFKQENFPSLLSRSRWSNQRSGVISVGEAKSKVQLTLLSAWKLAEMAIFGLCVKTSHPAGIEHDKVELSSPSVHWFWYQFWATKLPTTQVGGFVVPEEWLSQFQRWRISWW